MYSLVKTNINHYKSTVLFEDQRRDIECNSDTLKNLLKKNKSKTVPTNTMIKPYLIG